MNDIQPEISEDEITLLAGMFYSVAVRMPYRSIFGNYSTPDFEDAEEWIQESIVSRVKSMLEDTDLPAGEQYRKWYQEKQDDGWIYGCQRNEEYKFSPDVIDPSDDSYPVDLMEIWLSMLRYYLRFREADIDKYGLPVYYP